MTFGRWFSDLGVGGLLRFNKIIHAHCVTATKMDGPQAEPEPYIIHSHAGDDKGLSLTICGEFCALKTVSAELPRRRIVVGGKR